MPAVVTHINPLLLAHLPSTPQLCWQGTPAQPPHTASGRGALPGISHHKQLAPRGGSRSLTVSRCVKAPEPRRPEVSSCGWELGRLASDQDFSNAKQPGRSLHANCREFCGCRAMEVSILHLQGLLGKPLKPQQLFVAWTQPKQSLTKLIAITMLSHVLLWKRERGSLEYTMLGVKSQVHLPPTPDPHSPGPSAMKWFLCHHLSIRIK